MYILEFILLELLMIYWIYRTVKYRKPNEKHPYSFKAFVGNIGVAILMIFTLVWLVAKKKSFFVVLCESITR